CGCVVSILECTPDMCRTIRHRTAASDCRKTLPANSFPKFRLAHWSACNKPPRERIRKAGNLLTGRNPAARGYIQINQENTNSLVGRDRRPRRSVVSGRNQNAIALCLFVGESPRRPAPQCGRLKPPHLNGSTRSLCNL